MLLSDIEQLIKPALDRFRQRFKETLSSPIETINRVGNHLAETIGKQLRPTMMLLSAEACGNANRGLEEIAVAIELLHNCSLLHDDVVDSSDKRRGKPTVNKMWGNKTAILCGDYYLANVMLIIDNYNNSEINRIVNHTVMEMSAGELLQLQRSNSLDIDIEHYYDTIYKKTATLMAACCEIGAVGTAWQQPMKLYGTHLGMAFQLRDDLLDYTLNVKSGKPVGNDLKEGKMTLPLITYIKSLSPELQEPLLHAIAHNALTEDEQTNIIARIAASPAMSATTDAINLELKKAIEHIEPLPPSPCKDGLLAMVDMIGRPLA